MFPIMRKTKMLKMITEEIIFPFFKFTIFSVLLTRKTAMIVTIIGIKKNSEVTVRVVRVKILNTKITRKIRTRKSDLRVY